MRLVTRWPKRYLPFCSQKARSSADATPRQRAPKYRKHKASQQATVTLDGRDFYLGPYGSKASRLEYDRLVGEWIQNGRRLPPRANSGLSIVELTDAYWQFAKGYYVKDGGLTDEIASVRVAIMFLNRLYAETPVADFGPLGLKNVRQKMIQAGQSRVYINKNIGRIALGKLGEVLGEVEIADSTSFRNRDARS